MRRISVPAHVNPELDRRYRRPPGLSDEQAAAHWIEHLDRTTRLLCAEHKIDPAAPDAIQQIGVAELQRAVPALAENRKPEAWTAEREAELVVDMESERVKDRGNLGPRTLSQTARRLAAWPKYQGYVAPTLVNRHRRIKNRQARMEAAA